MHDLKWSDSEKKIARRVFQAAVSAELQETIADFKRRAVAVSEPEEMWELEEYLRRRRTDIDRKYDYRYSQLVFVFGYLLREKRIGEADLAGLSEDKLEAIRRVATL
ncbi:MAG: hypothetical protein ACYC0T_21685 [Ramlibacter sp.]